MESSLRLGRLGGIEIGVNYSWIIIFGLVTWSLAAHVFPETYPGWSVETYWLIGALASLLLFVSVLAHELAHSFVAIARGMPVRSITLFLFGGVSNIEREPDEPLDELLVTIVGPLTSVVAGLVFGGLLFLLGPGSPYLHAMFSYLAAVNFLLAVFNLIPGFPLDGGRVLRSFLWWLTGNLRQATQLAATVGQGIAYLFMFGGLYIVFTGSFLQGIWLIFIGWFLASAAEASARQVTVQEMLRGIPVDRVMNPSPVAVHPDVTIQHLVDSYVLQRNIRALPVVVGDQLIGMVTLADIRHVPREQWDNVLVHEVMRGIDELAVAHPGEDLADALRMMGQRDLNQLPVVDEGRRLVGLVSRSNLIRYLQVREELGYQR
ncbi:MAG: site-2 protease family protein [Chloroflexi bacterium]|nr:site-2 protease family protein [Chloroflexota bacterium]